MGEKFVMMECFCATNKMLMKNEESKNERNYFCGTFVAKIA